ncbi:hypothetical protein PAPYR_13041 [Paratrimastix pyriformis]|uniref:Uncharacterized protein n=1 Tax=Paratrimastix pyriformis TaxID=342808 RepID=A0ABQ8U4H0_9EUKA|nr:hypothetical protein PAPYR_13041 [Paratrimastix pyriformis]
MDATGSAWAAAADVGPVRVLDDNPPSLRSSLSPLLAASPAPPDRSPRRAWVAPPSWAAPSGHNAPPPAAARRPLLNPQEVRPERPGRRGSAACEGIIGTLQAATAALSPRWPRRPTRMPP